MSHLKSGGQRLRVVLSAIALASALTVMGIFGGAARAETSTFANLTPLSPEGGAGNVGPANQYPSSITVSGLPGTVTKATVTLIDYDSANADDTDMVITGPNGAQVMLMSDACGINLADNDFTFDDSAQTFLSNNGPCASGQMASFKPSNYLGAELEPDDLTVNPEGGALPGPAPPYVNALSSFNGASPDGAWNLFMLDDNAGAGVGFDVDGWALTLEVQPPVPATPAATGERDAALKKCKAKKSKKARRKCKQKARALPL